MVALLWLRVDVACTHRRSPLPRSRTSQLGFTVALVVIVAGLWWGWFAWDDSYQRDEETGEVSGPYELWQGIGCGICWVVLVLAAERFLRPWILLIVMPLSFTAAYSLTVIPSDQTGLAGIGVILVAAATFLGTLAVIGVVEGFRRTRKFRDD